MINYFQNKGHKFFKFKFEQTMSFKDNNDKENENGKEAINNSLSHYLFPCSRDGW